MKRLIRPFGFNNPQKCFWYGIQILAVAGCMMAVIMLLIVCWAIRHPPKFHQASYAAYYDAEEYKHLMEETRHSNNNVIPAQSGISKATLAARNRPAPSLK